jgi:hypothetical protein
VFNKNISGEVRNKRASLHFIDESSLFYLSDERAAPDFMDERGSATTEFVLLALPLFLPALLFFLSLSNSANSEMEASFLARQAVNAFVGGKNDLEAHMRVDALLKEFQKNEMAEKSNEGIIKYSIRCSDFPCITRGGEVELTLQIEDSANNTSSISIVRSTVDKW